MERQIGASLSEIREDHLQRYLFAASRIPPGSRVLDCACGVGYGSNILAQAGSQVVAVDISRDAITYARKHWQHPGIEFLCEDAMALPSLGTFDYLVSFETLEHLSVPRAMLDRVDARNLIGSVPNEGVVPFSSERFPYHVRHYHAHEVPDLIQPFSLDWMGGQVGKSGQVLDITPGSARFLVFIGSR